MLSWYTAQCKYTLKLIQIIVKLDETFNHILNMNWLYHFNCNWKIWFMWFHKKHLDKFFIQMNISVLKKNILSENYFQLKDDQNYVGQLCIKIHFICLSKRKMKLKKKIAPKIYQNMPKTSTFFLPKMVPYSVLSPWVGERCCAWGVNWSEKP